MEDEELARTRDEVRCEATVQTIKDVLWRFDELAEGTYSIYDLIGYVVEDLVKEGCCAACINDSLAAAFNEIGADPTEHRQDNDTVH